MKTLKNKIKQLIGFDTKVNNRVANIMRKQEFFAINDTQDLDVFIAGFPKSGNTWMQNLVTGMLLDSTSYRITPKLVNEVVPDVHAKTHYKRIYPMMVFKTHEMPLSRFKRVIHLVRDGRDAMLSYHKMEVNRNKNYKHTLDDMIIDGKGVFPAKWHVHTKAWLENPYNAELMTIKYEDLLKKPLVCLKRISEFLQIELTNDRLEAIYKANHIDTLRKKVVDYGWDYDYAYKNKSSESFFGKGTSGNYTNELNTELKAHFVNESKEELKHFGYFYE